jgi:hypothetical protein
MIAQVMLSALLSVVVLYAWTAYRQSPIIGMLSVMAAFAGLYFVWIPSHAMVLAEWVGIGRGVDLIIYIWVVISLILILNLHLKIRAQLELITVLARKIAIANVARRDKAERDASPPR